MTNKITLGILAHVDAGKTTLSESLLYLTGRIRKLGRVDHKSAFLDTFSLERERGITIFSKQAILCLEDKEITLLDTPGHMDFSSEMERTLQVLDYAILVINGSDGVQSHTLTLWDLLKRHRIPTFIFVNKMDQTQLSQMTLLADLTTRLSDHCIPFDGSIHQESFLDALAMCNEKMMEAYLNQGIIGDHLVSEALSDRKLFPVFFGSALRLEGIESLLKTLAKYMVAPTYGPNFGARIFKITRDDKGTRLTHLKVMGGSLKVKSILKEDEKIDQIRSYDGSGYDLLQEATSGTLCAVTGPLLTRSGEGLGICESDQQPILSPILTYRLILPQACDVFGFLANLRQLEEEEPHLAVSWQEEKGEIHVRVMGDIELEILKYQILERFGIEVSFDTGSLVYKETITQAVIGIGHFEPLKHYAEVHLLLEPLPRGSGIELASRCSEDDLDRNWQRLILSHLAERKHPGVLTGSEVTDIRITLLTGRAHLKHTEGGDFRQATFRALRQGLKSGVNRLLEPMYEFRLEVPSDLIGRAMNDINRMQGTFMEPHITDTMAVLKGVAPVATMRDYPKEVLAYSKGMGKLYLQVGPYQLCHNEEIVLAEMAYDAETDLQNPTGSVFCAHGAGYNVAWDQVVYHKHLDSGYILKDLSVDMRDEEGIRVPSSSLGYHDESELEAIFDRTYGKRKTYENTSIKREFTRKTTLDDYVYQPARAAKKPEKYLLVDGYNIIFAWDTLKELAETNLDTARIKLLEILSDYQPTYQGTIIVVFDAYKVIGGTGSSTSYHNIYEVYTKEAETADQYIEKMVHQIASTKEVVVATSDALEQMIILGKGARKLSAQGLLLEIRAVRQEMKETYLNKQESAGHFPFKDLTLDPDQDKNQ